MPGPSSYYSKTDLPTESASTPVASQPFADIEQHYNRIVRSLREVWACINGENPGVDVNNTALTDYSLSASLGLLPRLTDIEDSGKINDSPILQLGAAPLAAGDREVRFLLGSTSLYTSLKYDNTNSVFKLTDNSGAMHRLQGGTPTASADYTTKQYVDGILGGASMQRFANVAAPVKASATTFSLEFVHCATSDGSLMISKNTSTTVSVSTTGINGIATSNYSLGMSGNITVTSGGSSVTGSGTNFTADFVVGDHIKTVGGQFKKITAISSATSMTISGTWASTETSVAYSRGGAYSTSMMDMNLYAVCDAVGQNVGFVLSNRNVLGGEAMVDLPSILKTGTASVVASGNTVTGFGTAFLSEFVVGQRVIIVGTSLLSYGTIQSIQSNTLMTISGTFTNTVTNGTVRVGTEKYRQLPFAVPVDGSGNIRDFICTGFPWNTQINFLESLSAVNNFSSTSATSYNLYNLGVVPKLCRMIKARTQADYVNTSTAPNYMHIGPSSGSQYHTIIPLSYNYNPGPAWGTPTITDNVEIPLDSSQQVWFQGATTLGCVADLLVQGVYMTEWRG